MSDLISRQAAISAICNACGKIDCDKMGKCEKLQLPPANCSEIPNNSDTISRQAAIDGLRDYLVEKRCPDDGTLTCRLIENEVINKLPSAEPLTDVEQSIDDKVADLPSEAYYNKDWKSDMISRQAAIDAIGEKSDEIYKTKQKGATYPHDDFFQGMAYAENVVKQLPPIQPAEPQGSKTGRWIRDEFGSRCGACGLYAYRDKFDRPWESPYCPNCGCKMEVEHEAD